MTRILVAGRDGQIGWELRRSLLPLGEVIAPGRDELDLARPDTLRRALRELKPAIVVNAAAYTAVDDAERDPAPARAVNAEAPGVLAEEARRCGALLVHYSTDYVFDGCKNAPYDEDDIPAPLNEYGRGKLAGERAIAAAGGDHLVLRTSWVYAARGRNFLRTILRLAQEREELRIVADQIGAPTWARFAAEATAALLGVAQAERREGRFAGGVFHLVPAGETSWHGFAMAIVDAARCIAPALPVRVARIEPIAASDYPLPAARPRNSRLSTENLRRRFGLTLPHWEHCMQLCLEELYAGR